MGLDSPETLTLAHRRSVFHERSGGPRDGATMSTSVHTVLLSTRCKVDEAEVPRFCFLLPPISISISIISVPRELPCWQLQYWLRRLRYESNFEIALLATPIMEKERELSMNEPTRHHKTAMEIVKEIAARIRHYKPKTILRVGIDGADGVGKTVFADMLARAIETQGRPVIRASVDGFHNSSEDRYRLGRTSPEGFYRDSYNYAELRKVLLDPLGPGGSRVYCPAIFDHTTNSTLPLFWSLAKQDAVLVFDGIFLHRRELRDVWNLSIFLDASFDVTIPRGAARGPAWGTPDVHEPSNQRYIEGQRLYVRDNDPQALAHIVIDYSDFTNPIITACRWPI